MRILQAIRRNIPNAITCLNLVAGVMACIYATQGDRMIGPVNGYQGTFIMIACAAVFDFCDGLAARLLRTVSAMGKELDSLCDTVSFGVAPAMMVYTLFETADGASPLKYVALLIAVCGVLRLARFNVDTTQSTSFLGMPIPANAIFWIGYVSWQWQHPGALGGCGLWVMAAVTVLISLMMVCRLRMFSLKFKDFGLANNWHRYLIIVAAIVLIALQGLAGLASTIVAYILLSALTHRRTKAHEA